MTSSSGTNRCVADGHEPVEDRRHLHPGEVLLAGLRVAHQHREVEREPGDVGERVRRVDGQRRQHREDPLPEQLLAAASARRGSARPSAAARCPPWRARGRSRRGTAPRAAASAPTVVRQICSSTSRGSRPEAAGTATPAAMRRLRPATRTMKNSSRLVAKIARNRTRSSSGRSVSSASSSTRVLKCSHDSSRSRNRSAGRSGADASYGGSTSNGSAGTARRSDGPSSVEPPTCVAASRWWSRHGHGPHGPTSR